MVGIGLDSVRTRSHGSEQTPDFKVNLVKVVRTDKKTRIGNHELTSGRSWLVRRKGQRQGRPETSGG